MTTASNIPEFKDFGKIARLSRDITITEKIDGTNSSILITEDGQFLTGSRSRWITPQDDNYGFSKWAHERKDELMKLGVGRHFGEWWGQGIQCKYGMTEKRWSLFNTHRWCLAGAEPQIISDANPLAIKYQDVLPECCHLVPVLYKGIFCTVKIQEVLDELKRTGSIASGNNFPVEGIIIHHSASNALFKKTIHKDEVPKTLA